MWKYIYNYRSLKPGDIIVLEGSTAKHPSVNINTRVITENNSTETEVDIKGHYFAPSNQDFSITNDFGRFYKWSPKGLPEHYKSLDCCRNCKHVFIRHERKAPTEYYCHVDESDRPLCGSIFMGESEVNPGFSWKEWEEWKEKHYIKDEFGKCDYYIRGS